MTEINLFEDLYYMLFNNNFLFFIFIINTLLVINITQSLNGGKYSLLSLSFLLIIINLILARMLGQNVIVMLILILISILFIREIIKYIKGD